MATPALVTVTGHIAGQGTVVFTRHRGLISAVDDTVIPPPAEPATAVLDEDGNFTIQLYATDDPDWLPVGWAYSVSVRSGAGMRGAMELHYADTAVDFDDVFQESVSVQAGSTYVKLSDLGVTVATLGVDGILAAAQRPPSGIFTGPTAPADPAEGDIWFDTSGA